MHDKIYAAIVKTLSYGEVFNYPLKKNEIWKYLISNTYIPREEFEEILARKKTVITRSGAFYYLKGSKESVLERIERERYSAKKLRRARKVAALLARIPSVRMVGITGSLAMNNCRKNDDIDFIIITARNTVWFTRLCVFMTLFFSRQKRGNNEKLARDKICTNLFLSETVLRMPKSRHTLYIAHEIAQVKVLKNKNNIYERFLQENKWVLNFLPNAFEHKKDVKTKKQSIVQNLATIIVEPLEHICFVVQIMYMKRRITNEKISRDFAFFHPDRKNLGIMELYYLKLSNLLPMEYADDALKKRRSFSGRKYLN